MLTFLACLLRFVGATPRRTRQPAWSLLWVLPYLFFAVCGDAFHTDAPLAPRFTASASRASVSDAYHHALAAKSSVQSAVPDGANSPCLACLWAVQSVGVLAASPVALHLVTRSFDAPQLRPLTAPRVAFYGALSGRGPPLS